MNRRGFLGSILAAAAAPAVVKAASIMRINPDRIVTQRYAGYPLEMQYHKDADFQFVQVQATIEIDSYDPNITMDELVRVTMRKHAAALAENITRNNALLKRLAARRVYA